MNKQNLMPQPAQPVNRVTPGQLPPELAELLEETLHLQGDFFSTSILSSAVTGPGTCGNCSYDGDDAD